MKLKSLGETDLNIPEVGLGTWNYHGGVEPLCAGLEQGALLIDTAESYGSEAVIGEAIRGIRERVFLATNVSPEHYRYQEVLRAADESLCRLGANQRQAQKRGRKRPETIYFLGFTLYCTRNRQGNLRVGLRTEKSRYRP